LLGVVGGRGNDGRPVMVGAAFAPLTMLGAVTSTSVAVTASAAELKIVRTKRTRVIVFPPETRCLSVSAFTSVRSKGECVTETMRTSPADSTISEALAQGASRVSMKPKVVRGAEFDGTDGGQLEAGPDGRCAHARRDRNGECADPQSRRTALTPTHGLLLLARGRV
jgi:hypothetical protein